MKRSTLAAALILGALAGYIYWFEREPLSDTEGEPVFDVQADDVTKIEIRRKNEEPVVVEKKEQAWQITAPLVADADPTEVDLLTENLATMRFERAVAKASEVSLEDFGLDVPGIEVRFETADGTARSLQFGADTPTPRNQYARRGGDEDILVIPSHLSLNFEKDGWALREKSVFPEAGTVSDLTRIDLERPSGKLVLEKKRDLWLLTEPYHSRADRSVTTSLASRWLGVEMRDVASESPAELDTFGMSPPPRVLRLSVDDREPLVLEVGDAKGIDNYARNPARAPVFLIEGDLVTEMDRAAREFVSKRLFDFAAFDANRFRIESPGSEAREYEKEVEGEETIWRRTAPGSAVEVSASEVEDFLYAVNGASASAVVEPSSPEDTGLDQPTATITVWSKDASEEERVMVSHREGRPIYARREGDEVALELTAETWESIGSKWSLEPKD